MKASLDLEVEHPETVFNAVKPDLQGSDRVSFTIEQKGDVVHIDVEADTIGVLQGSLNTAIQLTKLSSKIVSSHVHKGEYHG